MALSTSFGLQGPNPFNSGTAATTPMTSGGSTPAAQALNGDSFANLFSQSKPSTPVKKITQGSDGSSSIEYHAPKTGNTTGILPSSTSQQPTYDAQGNAIIPSGTSSTTVGNTPPPITGNTTTPSGATVNASTGQTITGPSSYSSTPSFPSTVSGLISTAQGNPAIAQTVQGMVSPYAKTSLQDLQEAQNLQRAAGALETTGGPSAPLLGNALAQAQLGTQFQSLGQTAGQLANAATREGLTAQQQEAQGLGTAAGAIAPSGNFPFAFNPATGQYSVSGGNLQGAISTGVQQAIKNPTLYSSLYNAVNGTYGAASAGMFQQAYIAAGGNPAVAAGQATGAQAVAAATGQTEAQNAITAGTAGTSAASTAYQSAVQNVSNATKQYASATGVANNLEGTLGSWTQSGLITDVNSALNSLAGFTSSPQYAQFKAALVNTQAAYTAAFSNAGITPTQSTQNALQELDPNSSASAIIASLNQLSSDLHAAIVVPAYQQQQTYAQKLGI